MKPGISIIPLNLPLRRETSQLQSIIPVCLPAPDDRQHGAALHRPAGERRGAALREERRRVYLVLCAEGEHREVGFAADVQAAAQTEYPAGIDAGRAKAFRSAS